jgi:hypothetical protein
VTVADFDVPTLFTANTLILVPLETAVFLTMQVLVLAVTRQSDLPERVLT